MKDIMNTSALEYIYAVSLIFYRIEYLERFKGLSFELLITLDTYILAVNIDVTSDFETRFLCSGILVLDLLLLCMSQIRLEHI